MLGRFIISSGALISAFLLIGAAVAEEPQDPPGRVGRLSYIEGMVQQRSADDTDWTSAGLNYPVTNGFGVKTGESGRAEIQVGSVAIRIGNDSELDVSSLADHETSLTLAEGEINVRLGRLASGDRIEVVTPRGVAYIAAAGDYHLDAGTTESPTQVAVFNGRIEVPRGGASTIVTSGQAALITGDDPAGIKTVSAATDPLDDWARSRDRPTRSASARTVSPEMTGGPDLDRYGTWRQDPRYGAMWYPNDPPADWAPYRYGRWEWVSPWGWTWIDDQPWGFAPFHYGRWVYTANGWAWVPGDYADYPTYAPALVGYVGSPGFVGWGFPWVSWFPLAPFEVFVPSFPFFVSIDFVRRVNIANVNIINIRRVNGNIVVNNVTNVTVNNFANRNFVTTVSTTAFTSSQSITRTTLIQSTTTGITGTTQVSFAPTNVTTPRTAISISSFIDPPGGKTASKPPLPAMRTSAGSVTGGSAATGAVATRTNAAVTGTTAGTDPRGQAITGTTAGTDPRGRSLPPLPAARASTTASTTITGGSTHAGGTSPPITNRSSPITSQSRQTGSPTVLRGRGTSPSAAGPTTHAPATTGPTMHAPATMGFFPHSPAMSGMPGGAPRGGMTMPRGFQSMPRAPVQHGGGQAQMHMNRG